MNVVTYYMHGQLKEFNLNFIPIFLVYFEHITNAEHY